MPKTIRFNTGRLYSAEGQYIVATLHDDGVVTFMDHSRGVDGEFKMPDGEDFTRVIVMHWYDRGMAPSTLRSHKDGMYKDGSCNAR